jgi:hypothetical protein
MAGCDSLLDVSNPNNIAGDDVLEPSAAPGLANGALAGIARGYGNIIISYTTLTDEFTWSGSRDAYQTLDFGNMSDPFNEFTDAEYKRFTQGRWMADEAVRILTIHNGNGELEDIEDLWRSHIYRAIVYMQIGDMYDDFVYSDRQESGNAIGPANMATMTYDEAIASLSMVIANSGNAAHVLAATALRARASHARAVWNTIGNGFSPTTGTYPGVVSPVGTGVQDAIAALAASDDTWRWAFEYSSATVSSSIHGWVNSRQEMRMGDAYTSVASSGVTYEDVTLEDLIDVGTVSPELDRFITEFSTSTVGTPMTIVSAREMYLILAEDALARGELTGSATAFDTYINGLRAIDGLTAFNGAAPQVGARDLLEHHRRTDLFMQGRRLSDHYRFGAPSVEWLPSSIALNSPGTFFPIPANECQSNPGVC